jgi:zinc and cadmium transporter
MNTLFWILGATILDGMLGLSGIFSLFIREKYLEKIIKFLVAFSAGALLSGGFFHLLAETLDKLSVMLAFGIMLIGFLAFFVLEEYLHWHHCEECDIHPYSYLMILGDSLHNFIDGLVIAAAFMANVNLGFITTILILTHELPQELGIFAVIVSGGIDKVRAIFFSFLAQITCVMGGIAGFLAMSKVEILSTYLLPFAAGGFIYIAAADLIPSMHKTEGVEKITSFVWLCLGLLFMLAVKIFFEV